MARITGRTLPSARPHPREVAELSGAVGEPASAAPHGPMLEVELVLANRESRAYRVDRHRRLHAVTGGKREHGVQHFTPHRALTRDRRAGAVAAAPLDDPAREPKRHSEAPADSPRERTNGQIALAGADRVDQAPELTSRGTEIPVAEQEHGWVVELGQGSDGRGRRGHAAAFPVRAAPAHDLGAAGEGEIRRAIARRVVGDDDARAGERLLQAVDRGRDPVGLVARGDDRDDAGCSLLRQGGYSAAPCRTSPHTSLAPSGRSRSQRATMSTRATPWSSSNR